MRRVPSICAPAATTCGVAATSKRYLTTSRNLWRRSKLPETDIIFVSQSPSIARWQQKDREQALNQLAAKFIQGKPHLRYIETFDLPLGADGQPRPELFLADKLHFNAEGYKLLAAKVRPDLAP